MAFFMLEPLVGQGEGSSLGDHEFFTANDNIYFHFFVRFYPMASGP
jgi:hypothetical protein